MTPFSECLTSEKSAHLCSFQLFYWLYLCNGNQLCRLAMAIIQHHVHDPLWCFLSCNCMGYCCSGRSHYVIKLIMEFWLMVLLSQSLKYWDYRYVQPSSAGRLLMDKKVFSQPYIIAFFICLEKVAFLYACVSDSVCTLNANGKRTFNNVKDICLQSTRTYYKTKL